MMLAERAVKTLVGGVNSPVRTFRAVGQPPVLLARGRGARVTDVDGRSYLDLIMGWGSLILGHAHPAVNGAIRRQLTRGAIFGLTSEPEIRLAETICAAVPSVERIRFAASGTEACMAAIRLARAATGRDKVLTFEGCYHGHSDGLLVKRGSGLATLGLANSAGVPASIAAETLIAPYHDLEALEEAFRAHGPRIACVILEPVAANMGVVAPSRAWLERIRTLATRHGALLIFDEVVTGFRVAWGGAQAWAGVTPDLTIFGKIIGGGMPIGAFGGAARVMAKLAPDGPAYHAGTFAGHPLSMVAGAAALDVLRREKPYGLLDSLGKRFATGLQRAAERAGVPVRVNRVGSMLTIYFTERPVERFADVQAADASKFSRLAGRWREGGILAPPSAYETLFLSTAHTSAHIDRMIDAAAGAFRAMDSS